MTQLLINGLRVDRLSEFSLRWLEDGTPVLYQRGKRVTIPWRLYLCHTAVDCSEEESANTAG